MAAASKQDLDEVCVICRDAKTGSIEALACGHTFHEECIRAWCTSKEWVAGCVCPLCRTASPLKVEPAAAEGGGGAPAVVGQEVVATDPDSLFRAVYSGDVHEVRVQLEDPGVDVNSASGRLHEPPLYHAAFSANESIVRLLLLRPDIQVNAPEERSGWAPLHRAVDMGHTEVVRLLLAYQDIDVNASDMEGRTPLYTAAANGDLGMVNMLLNARGIHADRADRHGFTPLSVAALRGHCEVVFRLLRADGVNVNAVDEYYRETPLHKAAAAGREDAVRLLLTKDGIRINQADSNGLTPLFKAVRNGRAHIVRILLALRDTDLSTVDLISGDTLLHAAADRNDEAVVHLLLDAGLNAHARNRYGKTAREYARSQAVVALLDRAMQHAVPFAGAAASVTSAEAAASVPSAEAAASVPSVEAAASVPSVEAAASMPDPLPPTGWLTKRRRLLGGGRCEHCGKLQAPITVTHAS
jgi:ankyrin repeat protein